MKMNVVFNLDNVDELLKFANTLHCVDLLVKEQVLEREIADLEQTKQLYREEIEQLKREDSALKNRPDPTPMPEENVSVSKSSTQEDSRGAWIGP
jgi:uncharacterized protein YdcH (DUF465 family)